MSRTGHCKQCNRSVTHMDVTCCARYHTSGKCPMRDETRKIKPKPSLSFQKRVLNWLMACFSMQVCRDTTERNHRFLEEALELVQSTGCTRSEAHQLVDYVFDRPVGEPFQEVGGVTITLSALCSCINIDQEEAGEAELSRISAPATMEKIRAKQAAKPKHSPLPQ